MPRPRALVRHALAVATGLLTYLGALIIEGLASGDLARALGREAWDSAAYWYFALPVCYLVAGVLGYLGRRRSWRWSLDMLATHAVLTPLFAGSSLDLWPLALITALILALPGMLTAWIGSLVWRLCAPPQQAGR
jgi:Na+-translocating ferredoxin:NAD+ oxidoreductase RnfD subunit